MSVFLPSNTTQGRPTVHLQLYLMNMNELMLTYFCAQKSEPAGEVNEEILANIEKAKKAEASGTPFKYEERDVILYNLGIGAKKTDLPYVLQALPLSFYNPL